MRIDQSTPLPPVRWRVSSAFALSVALLATGCGGGADGLLAADAAGAASVSEQAALNRAVDINSSVMSRTVAGERATSE